MTGPDEAPPPGQRELGIRIAADRGRPALLVDLEGQEGGAEVVAVGELYGITVVVLHHVRAAAGSPLRDYLAFYGRLE